MSKKFKLTNEHILILKAVADNMDTHDGFVVCQKRPMGNSDIGGDIAEIIGLEFSEDETEFEKQSDYCWKLWDEMPLAFKEVMKKVKLDE